MMRILDRKLLRDLWRLRGQVLAIVLVMGAGAALLVMANGTLAALRDGRDAYYERYRFADLFANVTRAPERLLERIAETPGVLRAETRVVAEVTLAVPGLAEPATGRLVSLPPPGDNGLNGVALRRGRLVEARRDDEVVVGEAFAEANGLVPGARIAAIINGRWRPLTVVGIALSPEYIYTIGRGGLFPDDRRFGILWMDRATLAAAMGLDGAFNDLAVRFTRDAVPADTIRRIDDLLAPYGGTGAYPRKDQLSHAYLDGELKQLRAVMWISTPIFLGVAAFLLQIVLARLVATEREQIGLLKALGYSRGDIAAHYLKLVGVIALLGTAAGVVAGLLLNRDLVDTYARYFRFPLLAASGDAGSIIGAMLLNATVAATATMGAVRRAAGLPPVEAMNPPAPPRYGRSTIERLGIASLGSPSSRMLIRHMLRWPLRASLTAAGIALGGAIVVGSLFSFDAIDRMVDLQMFRANRADATISFTEARDAAVMGAVARLPGVLVAEPVRVVPVRLRHGHRQRRTALTAVWPESGLRQLLDEQEQVFPVPDEGLVLSARLARQLGAGRGDAVTVEVLDGRRTVRAIPIAALVEEFVGMGAYMNAEGLARLLNQGATVSGADLKLDAGAEAAFFDRLKDVPAVAGVSLRRTALQSLRATIADSLSTMIIIYVGFAGIITFGVVFNSARIALSERGRELATLRVLGFHRHEVAYVLFGELAVLTLLALPLAALAGYGMAGLLALGLQSDLYRIPLVVLPRTYALSVVAILASVALSILAVHGRLRALDPVAALKARD